MRIVTATLLASLSLVACRDTTGGDDTSPDGSSGDDMRIQEIQNDTMAPGSPVTVRGVVVTAVDAYGARTGDFYVEEPEGGPFSGVKVYNAPLDQVATLVPGDLVDITGGIKDEFALNTDSSGRTLTEIKPASGGMLSVTKVGTAPVPAPGTVDANLLNTMSDAERKAEWEKWEGVLVTVTNARQNGTVYSVGSGEDQKSFDISGGLQVSASLAPFPASAVYATCYAGVSGFGDYIAAHDLLVPRGDSDLAGGGTNCPAAAGTTIAAIQTGTTVGSVELHDVYVAAVSFNRKNIWVSTSLTAAQNEGLYVYRGNATTVTALPADVVVGAKVDVAGTAEEGNNDAMGDTITQIKNPAITVKEAPGSTMPAPMTGQSASDLNVAATGEPFESVLVTLTAVKVMNVGDSTTFYVGQLQQGATTFLSDDDILRLAATDLNKCFDMTGVWSYLIFSNAYGLLPIAKTEVTCP